MKPDDQRVVITGLGVVSPLGNDVETFRRRLAAGECGTRKVTPLFPTGYRADHCGVVDGVDAPEERRTSRLAEAAARQALSHAGLQTRKRCGVVLGTAMGEGRELEARLRTGDAFESRPVGGVPRLHDTVADALELDGPSHLVATTCASGNHAADWARQLLLAGQADAMLAVGADTVGWVDQLGFARLLLQAPDRCRPFDKHRKGTILSEGAGAVLLERLDRARARGATPLAELAGCGLSCDAGGAFKSRREELGPLLAAAHAALHDAGLGPEAIDHVSAHGSGTKLNDARETLFAKALLGERAAKVPISGLKSMLGHAQGAAASFELVAAVLTLQHDVLFPTIGLETPDPDCDLDYVPNVARAARVDTILSNAFGVGGNNALAVVRRLEPY